MEDKVNLAEKLATFSERFSPKIVGRYNDDKLMVVKVHGEFTWHSHPETDDLFLVLDGRLTIRMRGRDGEGVGERAVELGPGELFVVPRGVEHCPFAAEEAHVLLIEPMGTVNTGDAGGPLTTEPEEI